MFERDGQMCTKCGTTKGKLTIDHKIRKADGGTDDLENLQVLCWYCHTRKNHLEQIGIDGISQLFDLDGFDGR